MVLEEHKKEVANERKRPRSRDWLVASRSQAADDVQGEKGGARINPKARRNFHLLVCEHSLATVNDEVEWGYSLSGMVEGAYVGRDALQRSVNELTSIGNATTSTVTSPS